MTDHLTTATIHSHNGAPCKVRYGDKTSVLNIPKGQSVRVDSELKVR